LLEDGERVGFLLCWCGNDEAGALHHPLDVIGFVAYALIIVEEGYGDGIEGAGQG
jgi:hypothetical protein